MDNKKYDIFISYRRSNGAATAKHLRDILAGKGYSVFFDTDSLRSGDFNVALLDVIRNCKDFIIVLSPNSLDRCSNEGDWVRLELACALNSNKNIIPIMSDNFVFPEQLPEEINGVRWKNGIAVNIEYFDAMVEKLISFLNSKPHKIPVKTLLIACVALCLIVTGIVMFLQKDRDNDNAITPTAEEKITGITEGSVTKPPESDESAAANTNAAEEPADVSAAPITEAAVKDNEPDANEPDPVITDTLPTIPPDYSALASEIPISTSKNSDFFEDFVPYGTAIIEDINGNRYTAIADSLILSSGNTMFHGFFSKIEIVSNMFTGSSSYLFDNGISFSEMSSAIKNGEGYEVSTIYGGSTDITLPEDYSSAYELFFIQEENEAVPTVLPIDELVSINIEWNKTPETELRYCTVELEDGNVFRSPVAQMWFGVNTGIGIPYVTLKQNLQTFTEISTQVQMMKSLTSETRSDESGSTTYVIITLKSGQSREVQCDRYFCIYLLGVGGAINRIEADDIKEIRFLD